MSLSEQPNTITKALRRVSSLADLDETRLHELAGQLRLQHATPGSCLLELGSEDPRLLFLIDGELELLAADGAARQLKHTDPSCNGPVSRLRPSHYQITTTSQTSYLMVEPALLDNFVAQIPDHAMVVEETYLVDEPNELIDASATHPLMFDLFDDINHGRIVVPSDPEIAIRVGHALADLDTGNRHLADTLSICPALTLKAMRSQMNDNSRPPIRSALQIIERVGPEQIYGLAVNCVLRESLRTDSTQVRERMQQWWRNTMRVTAIARTLARNNGSLDPDYAALIALFHAIADPLMLGYADPHDDLRDPTALDNVLHDNRAELGRILLTLWHMPREIVEAAAHSNHWEYDHPGAADYTDLILASRWHAAIGEPSSRPMPRFQDIPAFARLGLAPASPELGIEIVEAANNAVQRANRLLEKN